MSKVRTHLYSKRVPTFFTYINPCGFETKGVTSMEKELGEPQDIKRIKSELKTILMRRFLAPDHPAES